jgi:hypothetical protein
LLVLPRDARRKRKEEKSEASRISRILSAFTCGFLGRHLGLRDPLNFWRKDTYLPAAVERSEAAALPPHSKKTDRPISQAVPEKINGELLDKKSFPKLIAPHE